MVKNRLPVRETQQTRVQSLDQEDPLEKWMASHGQRSLVGHSTGSQRVGYDSTHAQTSTKREFLRANWIRQLVATEAQSTLFFLIILLTSQQDWARVG